jgi:hypothetical protein
VRASFVIAPEGIHPRRQRLDRLGVGLDYTRYSPAYGFYGYRDQCLHFEPGPAGTQVCTDVTSNGGSYSYVFVPAVMQWNFWFTERFSAFRRTRDQPVPHRQLRVQRQPRSFHRRPVPARRPHHLDRARGLPTLGIGVFLS